MRWPKPIARLFGLVEEGDQFNIKIEAADTPGYFVFSLTTATLRFSSIITEANAELLGTYITEVVQVSKDNRSGSDQQRHGS